MTDFAISSIVYGANVRSSAGFGDNIIGFLPEASPVTQTGPQVGDRWIPCRGELGGATRDMFVSKNVLRKRVSEPRERLVRAAVAEWFRFDKGQGKEHQSPYFKIVGEYWKNIGMDLNGLDRGWPWSAAYISFCIEKAGGYGDFKQAAAHSRYVHQAVKRRENNTNGSFWGFRLNEHKPAIGDIVCMARGSFSATYDHAKTNDSYSSHCDIVIAVRDDHVSTLGGNVAHTVKRKSFAINANGFLKNTQRLYAVMRNNK